jgi:hypothetical protein
MWRIFQSLRLYAPPDYHTVATPSWQPQVLALDPIHVAGRARLDVLRAWASSLNFQPCLQSLDWIQGGIDDLFIGEPPCNRAAGYTETASKYEGHFMDLMEARVLHEITFNRIRMQELRFVSTYFAIPKDATKARSIFNGKLLSLSCKTPPPVNLPEVASTTRRIIELVSQCHRRRLLGGFTADIRHWFHQIAVAPEVSRFFGLRMSERYFEWTTLPMGWSHSPYICQCLAWTAILYSSKKDNSDGLMEARKEACGATELPQYVTIRDDENQAVGFVTLTYDNIGVWCTDHRFLDALHQKIIANFERHADIALKEHLLVTGQEARLFDPKQPPPSDFKGITYLGVQYGVHYPPRGPPRLFWRHEPTRIEQWPSLYMSSGLEYTARQIARVIGIILWHHSVAMWPLCRCAEVVDILRQTAIYVNGEREAWDKTCPITQEDITVLNLHLGAAISNAWNSADAVPSESIYMFTDAAGAGRMGCVIVDAEGRQQGRPYADEYPLELTSAHIFVQEMHAATF